MMMAPKQQSQALTIRMSIHGVTEVLRALRAMPKDANNALRDASVVIAEGLAVKAKATSSNAGPQGSLLEQTVKVLRDRIPVVQAGGTKRVGRNKAPAFKVLFGAEFGSNFYDQFHGPHTNEGYWLFPLIRTEQPFIANQWNAAADDILQKFGSSR